MIAARLSMLLLFSMALEAAQTDQGWTGAGITDGVTLAFRDDSQLNARQVRAVAGRVPPHSGAVRMARLRGSWTVELIDTSRSRVTYQIAVRPGGSIPDWMVRRGAASALPEVIGNVSRCLSSPERRDDGRCPKPS